MYNSLQKALFLTDPEWIHHRAISALALLGRFSALKKACAAHFVLNDPRLEVEAFGLRFPNPVGLAAGFDKNAEAVQGLPCLGFGSIEIGSVTALAQPGNPRPRLFRLPEDQALINRMGFNNHGAEAIALRLEQRRQRFGALGVPLGVNLGKSKVTELKDAASDYERSMALLWPYADYFVINVSSPNTPGLRQLQERSQLEALLTHLLGYARARAHAGDGPRPLLLKIAPDLNAAQLEDVVSLVLELGVDGLIATNTTLSREGLSHPVDEDGGLSGRPLNRRALEVLEILNGLVQGRVPLVSVGGIFCAEDVLKRIQAGATLVQVYTGFVYGGPGFARRLNEGLIAELERRKNSRLSALRSGGD